MSPHFNLRWHRIPGFSRAFVLWWPWRSLPTMYIPRTRQDDPALVELTTWHELVHVRQWVEMGRLRFVWRYFADWIVLAALMALLWWLASWPVAAPLTPVLLLASWYDAYFPEGRAELEAEAFAESVRWYREKRGRDMVAHYSVVLSHSYWLGPIWDTSQCRRLIESYLP